MSMRPLTVRQRQIFDFICQQIAASGYAPSLAEICEKFHLSSLATVHKHLVNLTEKGYIVRRWGHSRAIEIVAQRSGCCPTCGRALTASTHNQEAAMEGEHEGATENADAPEPMTADGSDGSEINPPTAEPSGDTDSGTDDEQGKTE